jgi:hypothetical protein
MQNGPIVQSLRKGNRMWGNLIHPELSNANVAAVGIDAALAELAQSPRLTSSGKTSEWTGHMTTGQKKKDEWYQGHYKRKGILERQKEETRRARWNARHPGAPENAWQYRQAKRKTRKASERRRRSLLRQEEQRPTRLPWHTNTNRNRASSQRKRRASHHRRP